MRKLFRKKNNIMNEIPKITPLSAELLRKVDIFKDLKMEEIEVIFKGVMTKQCVPGTIFFTPDDRSERLFILKEGEVDLYRLTPSGKRLAIRRVGPGTIFGEMGLLGQSMQGCFAEAIQNSLVCVATKDDILTLFRQHPDISIKLLEILGGRIRLLEDRLEQLSLNPVKIRLANWLLSNADAKTNLISGFTHEEIGGFIGASRQTVTETLNELQSQKLIEIGHKKIRVVNREKLEAFAELQAA